MSALCLIVCALTLGQNSDRAEWRLAPQYPEGLELVYKGICTEESFLPGVEHQRQYALETIFLVRHAENGQGDAVLQTSVSLKLPRDKQTVTLPGSIRLETLKVDRRGKLHIAPGSNFSLAIPLNGPAPLETGIFGELPIQPVNKVSYWEEFEEGRGLRGWRVLGAEQRCGSACVKLEGIQQSSDWVKSRGDSVAWRRQDIIWFAPQLGLVLRIDRTIEKRDPAHSEPTYRLRTIYELESQLRYADRLLEDRRQEIAKIRKFHEDAAVCVKELANHREKVEGLVRRIVSYMEGAPPTPYRKLLVQLQGRLERALKGELIPEVGWEDSSTLQGPVPIGKKAPDFIVADLISQQSRRFYKLLGQPILILYYDPATDTGREVLRFAEKLHGKHGDKLLVLGMAVSDDTELIREQYEELGLSFPVLDGRAMHRTFGVDGTPRIVLLDGEAVVRYAFTGWGNQSPGEIQAEVKRCLGK